MITVNGVSVLVAEVDLLTSFAPGDNFRVAAAVDQQKAILESLVVVPGSKECVPTSGGSPANYSPQLSIWRYLHIEMDCTEADAVKALMQPNTTNRQSNRFADAYVQPEYATLNTPERNPNSPNPENPQLVVTNGNINPQQVGEIDRARNSKRLDSAMFWVVYLTDAYPIPPENGFCGITFNKHSVTPFEASVIFSYALIHGGGLSQEDGTVATGKVAIHEVAHQILAPGGGGANQDGHRGSKCRMVGGRTVGDVADYYRASPEQKGDAKWVKFVNIMAPDAQLVPMNNADAHLPEDEEATAGPYDMFYFHSLDILAIRKLVQSP